MLFNSFSFLFFFLPITLIGFFVIARIGHLFAAAWLALASLVFYGWWNVSYIWLLLASIVFNYLIGSGIARRVGWQAGDRAGRWLLIVGVTGDLALLAYFKYFNFFMDNFNALAATPMSFARVALPIGISFFTFTQIAFLVDAYKGKAREYNFIHYGLFVTYFPHLIAGPVLHHKDMMPQFQSAAPYRASASNLSVGATIFCLGLAKKVLMADFFAAYAKPVFDADDAATVTFLEAWAGALAYTLQLYFDFSAYSDMAIGLSRLFGVKLPLNFNSPYKSANISEFWRRWHMTLSRFLRDYLYIPLGGNRKGKLRRYSNLLITMLLGGLWHGAGWTYVVWGGLHGLYLCIHHAWQAFAAKYRRSETGNHRWLGVAITFIAVVVGWVFFRAPTFERAATILSAMFGAHGIVLPEAWFERSAASEAMSFIRIGAAPLLEGKTELAFIAAGLLWVWCMPNVQELMRRFDPASDFKESESRPALIRFEWTPAVRWALVCAIAFTASVANLTKVSDFLYFQF